MVSELSTLRLWRSDCHCLPPFVQLGRPGDGLAVAGTRGLEGSLRARADPCSDAERPGQSRSSRRQAGSDHDLGYVGFEADRIVVMDCGGRQYLLTFRPYQRPPDPAVSTDYCSWVIDNDPDEGEIRCGTELRATPAPEPPSRASVPLGTSSCGAAVRPATVPAGGLRSLLARTCRGSSHDPRGPAQRPAAGPPAL